MSEDMNPEEMKEMEQKVIGMCICRSCPTYVQGADPIGYCFPTIGKNVKIIGEDQYVLVSIEYIWKALRALKSGV